MSNRSMTTAMQTELGQDRTQPIYLVELQFATGSFYMTDSYKQESFGGNTYLPYGDLLSFSDIEESAEMQVSSITAAISNLSQDVISAYLQVNYIDRPVKIYKAFLDSNEAIIADPVLFFEGRMDGPTISEDPDSGTSTITVSAADHFVDFERRTYRRTNHESQQLEFPGDKGFEFASQVLDFTWGAPDK